jgi:hypothetical protein
MERKGMMEIDFSLVLMAGQIGRYIIYIPALKSAPQDHQREEGSISLFFPYFFPNSPHYEKRIYGECDRDTLLRKERMCCPFSSLD